MLFLISGCNDTVTSHYATRDEAEADHLFGRGWLPSLLPNSASDITTSNELDINISEGSFQYDPKETNIFLKQLKPFSGQELPIRGWKSNISKKKNDGYDAFEYSNNMSIWVFLVNNGTGHVQYMMWLKRNGS